MIMCDCSTYLAVRRVAPRAGLAVRFHAVHTLPYEPTRFFPLLPPFTPSHLLVNFSLEQKEQRATNAGEEPASL